MFSKPVSQLNQKNKNPVPSDHPLHQQQTSTFVACHQQHNETTMNTSTNSTPKINANSASSPANWDKVQRLEEKFKDRDQLNCDLDDFKAAQTDLGNPNYPSHLREQQRRLGAQFQHAEAGETVANDGDIHKSRASTLHGDPHYDTIPINQCDCKDSILE